MSLLIKIILVLSMVSTAIYFETCNWHHAASIIFFISGGLFVTVFYEHIGIFKKRRPGDTDLSGLEGEL